MTPTPEHIERLALAGCASIEPMYHARIECSSCSAIVEAEKLQEEPEYAAGELGRFVYRAGWRIASAGAWDENVALCPDCAADATEEQA